VLLHAFARLMRIRVGVGLQGVPVRCRAAGVPSLADALLHPAAALLEQVPYVPLRDALLHPPSEDRRCVRDHRLVGGEQSHADALQFLFDPCRVCGHPREAVDALDDHRVKASLRSILEQLGDAAVAGNGDIEG
jgi:hypothetical protein